MGFILNANTVISYEGNMPAVINAVNILKRDIAKKFIPSQEKSTEIVLTEKSGMEEEAYIVDVAEKITIYAADELGFVYGLLYISEKFLGIQPFWFWLDQKIETTDKIEVEYGTHNSVKPIIKYRGWFVNDEVLIMKWNIGGDSVEPWRMVFEALLRCGGNMVIPGTDKNSKIYNKVAAEMGLWITHHHAEPLGAEMFTRVYPDMQPNYTETPELFEKIWEDGVITQKDYKVIWSIGFRGQGDYPFWGADTSGRFDTSEKRGKLISEVMELQKQIVLKYVKNPIFCTNLYGEIMELYEEGYIDISDDVIKISADNGYGKMVTRRRDNHTVRISSLPKTSVAHGGIYYHASFYDLQAANHMTMFPNSIDFVNEELSEVIEKKAIDYWIINCSNVRPHAYCLDAIRKKWYGEEISDARHSVEFADTYYNGNTAVAEAFREYHKAMIPYGQEADEHVGEQFYTENIRIIVHSFYNGKTEGANGLKWLVGMHPLEEQVKQFAGLCRNNLDQITAFYDKCIAISNSITGEEKRLFDTTLLLHTAIHYYCTKGVIAFEEGYCECVANNFRDSFMHFGDSAALFKKANELMRESEYEVWQGYYFNDCFADIKHTAYMVEKMMSYVRERGDNIRHDMWYREAVYAPEDRRILTLLVNDNHMTDWELYEAFKRKED